MATDVGKFHFRLVLLGSNRTGFLFKKFETKYKPTVEDLFTKDFDLGSIEIKVDFLDTSGSMQFPAMRRLSITTGSAFLIVYSVDDESSFEVLKMCMSEIQEVRPDYQEIPIVFAGNKCETPRCDRKVTKESVSNYVYYELPRLRTKVIECSCKENVNIDQIFKAYLSLAKVSLSSAVSANLSRKRPSHVPNLNDNSHCSPDHQLPSNKRTSSVKNALGVRKSCDASIATSMKNMSISSSRNSKEQLATMKEDRSHSIVSAAKCKNNNNNNNITLNQQQQQLLLDQEQQQQQQDEPDEVSIKDALEQTSNRLSIDHAPKPRSRSLIWRPQRKSLKSSSESSDCQVS